MFFNTLRFYNIHTLLLLILLSLPIVSHSDEKSVINLTTLSVPQQSPDFKLIDINNTIYTPADFVGKPIIVNFWATWCPPCLAELPSLNRAWEKVKNKNIEMLAINIGEEPETVFNFLKKTPINFKVLLDPRSEQLSNWQVHALPSTYVINYKGEVVYQAIGEREWDNDEFIKAVLALSKPINTKN